MVSEFSLEGIMVILFASVFTFFMFGFAIISIVVFFSKYKKISEFDKKFGFKIVYVNLALHLILLIFAFLNNRVLISLEYFKTILADTLTFDIPYPAWVIIFLSIFIVSLLFSSALIYFYTTSGTNISRNLKIPTFPYISNELDTIGKKKEFNIGVIVDILCAIIFLLGFTYLLFKAADTTVSPTIKKISDQMLKKAIIIGKVDAYIYMFLIIAAFKEEIFFRLFIQRFLMNLFKNQSIGLWFGILTTSIIWSIGHYGLLQPGWVKLVQIFIFGIVLGVISHRRGISSAIAIHVIFNILTCAFNHLFLES
ncbi:CPBP family intramembrane metalloprotease [Candidatus Dependentiae bacterium]|nr:CPBP family intramembrane metalloprotease [Candidatus Dependentiae bacterium]